MAANPPYAIVTLLTSSSYLPGALVLAHALRDLHPRPALPPETHFQTVCLVTPELVDVADIRSLRQAFDLVLGVEVIDDQSQLGVENLGLLGRRDLTTVLTKLHVFRLTQFERILFLDADTLPLQPLSHLFTLQHPHKLAAAPDAGWPDCFNSGVVLLQPSEQAFEELRALARTRGSWDGGDQGLLNEWAGEDWHRISFTYNTTPTAAYTYKPAYARYHEQIKLLHFIGSQKPWLSLAIRPSRPPPPPLGESHDTSYGALVDQWYAVYDRHYRPLANVDDFGLPEGYQPGTAPAPAEDPFHPPRYAAAWDLPQPVEHQPQGFGLEQLRELALKGVGKAYTAPEGEGRYESLPLDGRVDLIPRSEEPAHEQEEEEEEEEEDATPRAMHAPPLPAQMGEYPAYLQRQPAPPPPPPPPAPAPPQQPSHAGGEEYFSPFLPPPPPSHAGREEYVSPFLPTPQEQQAGPSYYPEQPPTDEPWHAPAAEEHPPAQEWHAPPEEPAPPTQAYRAPTPPPVHHEPFVPPLMTWNPASEPPPNSPPRHPASFPEWTGNVWEHSSHHAQAEFFAPPPVPGVPQHLLDQGHYAASMGHAPDPKKVNQVFPWEALPRAPSGRVWPRGESPPPPPLPEIKPVPEGGESLAGPQLTVQSPSPTASTPAPAPPSPGFPPDMTFRNAWDADPHIQRYVSKLSRPAVGSRQSSYTALRRSSPLATPGIKGNFSFRRPRERGEGADASSRDGDDEDDEEGEESDTGEQAAPTAEDAGEAEQPEEVEAEEDGSRAGRKSPRSRTGSVSTTSTASPRAGEGAGQQSAKSYRSQAVQTEPPPKTKSRGVQVARTDFFAPREAKKDEGVQTAFEPVTAPRPQLEPSPMPVPDTQYLLPQLQLPATPSPHDDPKMPTTADGLRGRLVDVETDETPVQALAPLPGPGQEAALSYESYFPPHAVVESPREVAAHPPTLHPGMEPLSPTLPIRPGPVSIPAHMRLSSNETQSSGGTISPPGSLLLSPKDGEEITSPRSMGRPSIRRWDPARDVDLFKRDSQEVLARFLRMNDWEEAR
ncbi:glycosyltransferase family 8 protein [Calocera viscosa TUFC12733]|uniref:glycogenin glucosyltransferase n=1 Tax=Calocera viscosa (strain TUFC12733) TaxID=1330018 RepID=A0A167LSS8_CALVF|nr:glycosyltransferase family 8 protein [Calocera viscosa TUFC12733]